MFNSQNGETEYKVKLKVHVDAVVTVKASNEEDAKVKARQFVGEQVEGSGRGLLYGVTHYEMQATSSGVVWATEASNT